MLLSFFKFQFSERKKKHYSSFSFFEDHYVLRVRVPVHINTLFTSHLTYVRELYFKNKCSRTQQVCFINFQKFIYFFSRGVWKNGTSESPGLLEARDPRQFLAFKFCNLIFKRHFGSFCMFICYCLLPTH